MIRLTSAIVLICLFFLACENSREKSTELKTEKVRQVAELGEILERIPSISDLAIAMDSVSLVMDRAQKLNSDSILSRALLLYGNLHKKAGQYDSASYYYQLVCQRASRSQNAHSLADGHRLIGVVYRIQGKLTEAYEHYLKAAAIYDSLSEKVELAKVYTSVGILYNGGINKDFSKALEYFKKAENIFIHLQDSAKQQIVKLNMAYAYRGLAQYDSAIAYLESNIAYNRQHQQTSDLAIGLRVLSHTYEDMGNHIKALECAEQSLKTSRESDTGLQELEAIQQLARINFDMGRFRESIAYAKTSVKMAETLNAVSNRMYGYSLLYPNYNDLNQPDSAYKYLYLYTALRDSIQSESKAKALAEMEAQFDSERKDAQIKLLTAEQEIGEHKQVRQRMFQIGLTIILLTLLIFSIYVIYTNRQKHRMEEKMLMEKMASMKDLVWKLSLEHSTTVEVGLGQLNEKLVTPLTTREMEVLELVLSNHSNQEISDKLFISVNTVKFHLKNIYDKMAVTSRREVVDFLIASSENQP